MKFIPLILIALIIPIFLHPMNNRPMSYTEKNVMRSDCCALFTAGALMSVNNIGSFKLGTFSRVVMVTLGSLGAKKLYLFNTNASGEIHKQFIKITQK